MKNYPFMTKLFIAFSLFIIVPVLIITSLSDYAIMHYSENEIGKSGIGKLKVSESIMNLLADSVYKDVVRLSLNPRIEILYDMKIMQAAIKNSNDLYTLTQLQNSIHDLVSTNNKYHSIYLYINASDFVMTTNESVVPKEQFTDTGWLTAYNELKGIKTGLTWLTSRTVDAGAGGNVISCIYSLPPYGTTHKGMIVVNIREDSLSKLINSNNTNTEGSILIADNNGNVLSNVDKSMIGKNIAVLPYMKQIMESENKEGYMTAAINDKKYLVSYLKTNFNNWISVGVFPLESLTRAVTSQRLVTVYISIILAFLGIALSYVISRKLYNPLKQLIQDIRKRKDIGSNGKENEMILLSKVFDNMLKQENQLFSTLEKNSKHIQENFLFDLLKGTAIVSYEEINARINFPYRYFLCAIVSIDKFKEFETNYSYEQQYYLKTMILNIFENILDSPLLCKGLVMEKDRIVLIINSDIPEYSEVTAIITRHFTNIRKEISNLTETSVSVSLGKINSNIEQIRESYLDAQDTLRYRFIIGHGNVICSEIKQKACSKYFYPSVPEKHIMNSLYTGSKDGIIHAIADFVKEIRENEKLSYDNIILILNQLIGSIIKYLLDSSISISMIFGNDFNIYRQLTDNETLDETGLWLSNTLLGIMEYCEKPRIDGKVHFSKIMDYIHNNYRRDIDINSLADLVGLSYSHVRKIFFDETGDNIVSYINSLRIEEARRMLRQTNTSINDIALSLGYNNNQSFNRFFKKFEGITPGEYRKLMS